MGHNKLGIEHGRKTKYVYKQITDDIDSQSTAN